MSRTGGTPLRGRRVLVTRPAGQAFELVALLENAGATVIHVPAIRFEPPPSWESLDRVIDAPESWDWVVFTSTNGVAFFAGRARSRGRDPQAVSRAKVAAVGAATASALRAIGIEPDVVPARFVGTEILPLLPDKQEGVRTAVVRAVEGRHELVDALRAKGGDVHLAVAYETRGLDGLPPDIREALAAGEIDALTFTSPSTVDNVLRHLSSEEWEGVRQQSCFVSIGPTTTSALRLSGIDDVAEARESSVEGLVAAVITALSRQRR